MAITQFYIRVLIGIFIFFIPLVGITAVPAWQIIAKESSLTFTGIMNDAPTSGEFRKFDGEIYFDPAKLNESHVRIIVDAGSVKTSYVDIAETLKTPEWFNVKLFPQAIFQAKKITKTGEKAYQAEGTLTIRDKTLPVIVRFTEETSANNKVRVKGAAKLKRTLFGVGQGEWGSTDDVKDEVTVNFTITAVKKG
ncbi:MAG: hypothetical protein ACD_45C00008G0006 [uncultured bacterium]|nr:MAG: hypothetical protein ACD_45C00008G0006 [uncultured bacterium]